MDGIEPAGLAALERRLRHDLLLLELPGKPWVPPRVVDGEAVCTVAVLGGGMCGLAAAAALRLLGIDGVRVLDRAAAGAEGPWVTFARMETLRSPKTLAGPALGLPSLTFRAWFEAQFGPDAWALLGKIPRGQWMEYLVWYRRVMALDVRERGGRGADPAAGGRAAGAGDRGRRGAGAGAARGAGHRAGRAGRALRAAGRGDAGPRALWAHSRDAIDFAALRGRRVGVVGAGASAMDNAATALEAGAARLDLFVRRARAAGGSTSSPGSAAPGWCTGSRGCRTNGSGASCTTR